MSLGGRMIMLYEEVLNHCSVGGSQDCAEALVK